jgi:predicted nucleic acid-binding Zn ribbon protein
MMTDPERLKEFLEKQRAVQLADGMLIMIISAIIMVISILTSLI